jgi:hypothetical protein
VVIAVYWLRSVLYFWHNFVVVVDGKLYIIDSVIFESNRIRVYPKACTVLCTLEAYTSHHDQYHYSIENSRSLCTSKYIIFETNATVSQAETYIADRCNRCNKRIT